MTDDDVLEVMVSILLLQAKVGLGLQIKYVGRKTETCSGVLSQAGPGFVPVSH